tara:strand:+ start:1167 stop:1823 length:657 start_codon:yes stop_codon:yes gene_type:complete
MKYYTYAYLREDRTPYYIGKGKGYRMFVKRGRIIPPPKDKSRIIFLKQNLTEEEAFKHEKYMIAVFGRKDLGTGILHNRTDGGDGTSGWIPSYETRKKFSEINIGRTHSQETKVKMSAARKGKTHSEETKAKMSGKNNPMYGKTHSAEVRIKISAAQRGENNHLSKLWKITTIDDNEITICGMTSWARENGYFYSGLYKVYTGEYKKHKDIIKVEVVS